MRIRAIPVLKLCCLCTLVSAFALPARPRDAWQQWGGPHRDFTLNSSHLTLNWPEGCPREMWRRPLGPGFSGLVADRSRIYTMYRNNLQEVVIALDARTGNTVWEYSYPAPYLKG